MQVSTNGVISFRAKFTDFLLSSFPFSTVPLIAPLWADFDFRSNGNVFYRIAEEETCLVRAREIIVGANPNFMEYYPSFCVIVTWSKATMFNMFSSNEIGSTSVSTNYNNNIMCMARNITLAYSVSHGWHLENCMVLVTAVPILCSTDDS